MADLTISEVTKVSTVQQFTGPAVEAITKGQRCRFDASTGKIALGNGTTAAEVKAGGIALGSAAAGETVTILNQGVVDVGDALDALNYGADIYVSDTDGAFGTAATDATVDVICGQVVPGWGNTTADKLLWLNGS
jgi:hypothetical protein